MTPRPSAAEALPAREPMGGQGDADGRFHVSVVCSGNICRSPMAAIVLRAALDEAGLGNRVRVTSAGTGPWWEGHPAHESTRRVLSAHGYTTDHVAHQLSSGELPGIDLVLAADRGHVAALRRLDPTIGDRVVLLRDFDPASPGLDLPDPYGGPESDYVQVMSFVRAAVPGIVADLRRRLSGPALHHSSAGSS